MPTPRILVPASHGKAVRLTAGQAVRVINTHGTQVVDCWAWNAYDLTEHMSMETTRTWTQHLNPKLGDTFVTTIRQPILTLVEDTSPGVHDTVIAACCRHRYTLLGVKSYHRNCRDNMFEAMQELGVTVPAPILGSFNIFMNIPVQPDGISLDTRPTVTRPGDYITLRAEMDCYVACSACPQDIVKIQNAGDNQPRDVELEILDSGFPDLKIQGPWVPAA